jgi:hypothetical protein
MDNQETFVAIYNPQISNAVAEGRYKDALSLTEQRNLKIWEQKNRSSFSEMSKWVRIEELFTKELLESKQGLSNEGEGLIFIVGLPRSGKTTLETLLSEIKGVAAGGELPYLSDQFSKIQGPDGATWHYPEYIPYLPDAIWPQFGANYARPVRDTVKGRDFIIDTMPPTFKYVGFIDIILPKAKIIHAVRSPLEHCLDIFSKNFTSQYYNFTYDWNSLGVYYMAYRSLMGHWERIMGDRILKVNFDELSSNPKKELRKIVDFCGIEADISPAQIAKKHKGLMEQINYMGGILKNYRPYLKEFEKSLGVFRRL